MKLTGKLNTSHEGLMIGNGILGALLYGENELLISLDRIDLWDNRLPKEFKNKSFDYQHLCKYLTEDYNKAFELFDNCYNHSYPTKINAGLINAHLKTSTSDYSEIDYLNGIVRYYGSDYTVSSYVDANKNVIVLSFEHKKPNFEILMPKYFYYPFKDKGLNYEKVNHFKDNDYFGIVQPIYNSCYHILCLLKNNDLYITIQKGRNIDKSKKLLVDYSSHKKEYFKKHLNYYHNYFSSSTITTPDQHINNLYYLGRYYFACNSRKKYPVTLHGVWTQNNDKLPPWKADYHNDINVEMSYEHFLKSGNKKEGKVLLDYLVRLYPQFRKNALNFMKTEGIYIPGVMTQKGVPLGGWPEYAFSPCCQIWLIKAFDEYYSYYGDINFLRNKAFPIFKDVEKSIFQILIEKNGFLELGFHSSPEYFENDKKSCFDKQSNFEITMLKYLYSTLIKYCEILKLNDSHYKVCLSKIKDLYRDENNLLMVSGDQKYDISHRHFSHLLVYKNMKMIDPFENERTILNDINNLVRFGTDNWAGFSFVEMSGLYSFVRDGENAYRYLKIFSSNFVHPNGFHMNNDYKEHFYSKLDCYVMTLEANFGFVNSLNDMYLEQHNNKVCIFPAIPDSFKQKGTCFRNLRLQGNHKVSGEYSNNKIKFLITLKHKEKILLFNNFYENPTMVIDGKKIIFKKRIGEFIELEANKSISFGD